jgi:hypothetical protein
MTLSMHDLLKDYGVKSNGHGSLYVDHGTRYTQVRYYVPLPSASDGPH